MSADAAARVHQLFTDALQRAGVAFVIDGNHYCVSGPRGETRVALDAVLRDYEQERDDGVIETFAARVLEMVQPGANSIGDPTWVEVSRRVYEVLEPVGARIGQALATPISKQLQRVLAWTSPDEDLVRFIDVEQIARWGVDESAVRQRARANLDALLADKRLETEPLAPTAIRVGMIPISTGLKASALLAASLREFVGTALSWPLVAIAPCRDFVLLMSAADADANPELVARLGGIALQEFSSSAAPLATELLRIDGDGIRAVGAFSPQAS